MTKQNSPDNTDRNLQKSRDLSQDYYRENDGFGCGALRKSYFIAVRIGGVGFLRFAIDCGCRNVTYVGGMTACCDRVS